MFIVGIGLISFGVGFLIPALVSGDSTRMTYSLIVAAVSAAVGIAIVLVTVKKKRATDEAVKAQNSNPDGTRKGVCPVCGLNVSDNADRCPRCGNELKRN